MGYINTAPTGANIKMMIVELTVQRDYPLSRHASTWAHHRELVNGANSIAVYIGAVGMMI